MPSNQIRSLPRGRKQRAVGVVVLAIISVATQIVAVSAISAPAPAIAREKAIMAAALLTGIGCRTNPGAMEAACRAKPHASALAGAHGSSHATIQTTRWARVKARALLWGVDSCKAFTHDPAASTGLYPQVVSALGGAPDFWGRYLTTTANCPGLSATEIAAAYAQHMGILPIYNDYNCSAVSGYQTASGYAQAAADAAAAAGIPPGTGIVIDIEPAGPYCPGAGRVDALFVQGWYDGLTQRNYVPIFYANSTAYRAFAQAYCAAVEARSEIATAWLWSFEPSLIGRFAKPSAPAFAPNTIGCLARHAAWQYVLSAGAAPDVDQDEALPQLPIWFP